MVLMFCSMFDWIVSLLDSVFYPSFILKVSYQIFEELHLEICFTLVSVRYGLCGTLQSRHKVVLLEVVVPELLEPSD